MSEAKPSILLAPDSFKGSLSARRFCEVAGAAIEMALASGFTLLPGDERRPLETTSHGTGELLAHALRAGMRRVVVFLGGSATTDAGTGCLAALGFRFLDRHGRPLPPGGGALERLARIEVPELPLENVELLGATDVTTPLHGPRGAARLFAPQKGATPEQVERLERGLRRFAKVVEQTLGLAVAQVPGAGAAGGLGAGLLLLGARLVRGFELVAELTGFEEHFHQHPIDLVITGEGRLDEQSRHGKVPVAVARIAARHGVPVAAVAGQITLDHAGLQALGLHAARSLVDEKTTPEMALRDPETALTRAVVRLVEKWRG